MTSNFSRGIGKYKQYTIQIREFINKERIYMLMLSFILLFNACLILGEKLPQVKENLAEKEVLGLRLGKAAEGEYKSVDEKILWSEVLGKKRHILILVNILGLGAVFLFCLGLFLDIRILMARLKKRGIFDGIGKYKQYTTRIGGVHSPVRWGIWDIFRLTIIFVFLGYILHIVEAYFFLFMQQPEGAMSFIPMLNTGIMDLALLGFIIYFVKVKYNQDLAAIGLKFKGALKNIFLAILSYIAFLPILAFLLLLMIWLVSIFNYQPPQQAVFKLFLREERLSFLIYTTIMVVILGPIVEEIFFRGFTYNAIKRRWGSSGAMALTAIIFAGLHGNLVGFLPIMALGFLLAYVYEKTGSLVSSFTIHILHNTLMVSFLFLARYFVA